MDQLGRVAWPALEEGVRLLRECSDWNPALKSAAGGLAHVLRIIRLRSDNHAACEDLLKRIVDVARDLANQPQDALDVRFRSERFERCLVALTVHLHHLHDGGKFIAHLRAERDAKVLRDCESELNAAVADMQLFLQLAEARRSEVIRQNAAVLLDLSRQNLELSRQNQHILLSQGQRVDEILDQGRQTQEMVRDIGQVPRSAGDSVLWRIELFSLFGQRCALARTSCGLATGAPSLRQTPPSLHSFYSFERPARVSSEAEISCFSVPSFSSGSVPAVSSSPVHLSRNANRSLAPISSSNSLPISSLCRSWAYDDLIGEASDTDVTGHETLYNIASSTVLYHNQ